MSKGKSGPHAVAATIFLIAAIIGGYWFWDKGIDNEPDFVSYGQAFRSQSSGVMVEVSGQVVRILRDDREGGMVQNFVLRTREGFDVMVSHAYDPDERVPVAINDFVIARGEYEWSELGGQVDWTTWDGPFSEKNGWIKLRGDTYQ